jgi:hypothetical protein
VRVRKTLSTGEEAGALSSDADAAL